MASKSRIAPMKNIQSLPRLALMGNLILCRLIVAIIEGLRGDTAFDTISCYTNSQICLAWICSLEKEFKTFVQNRVLEIRNSLSRDKWFYCRLELNPADLLTRTNLDNLSSHIWFEGPTFLYNEQNDLGYFNSPENRNESQLFGMD